MLESREVSSNDAERELNDTIEHWVNVIDRWVQGIDSGLGREAEVGEPVVETGPPADAEPGAAGLG